MSEQIAEKHATGQLPVMPDERSAGTESPVLMDHHQCGITAGGLMGERSAAVVDDIVHNPTNDPRLSPASPERVILAPALISAGDCLTGKLPCDRRFQKRRAAERKDRLCDPTTGFSPHPQDSVANTENQAIVSRQQSP